MEINSAQELWLLTFCFIAVLSIVMFFAKRYQENKRLKEAYPEYTKAQRKFMCKTVEVCDEIILQSLRSKYDDENVSVYRERQVVQRSEDHLVIHIHYTIPKIGKRLVVFNSDKRSTFIHDKNEYMIGSISIDNIPAILI
jgi:hypothetical protein